MNEDSFPGVKDLYKEYFLDYASYVILERAVPDIDDGLKPVQRRILFAMKKIDDGRFHKVANIIGQTMSLHPHGDAAIGGALIKLGQKDLLIDCQGNWGDIRTGDSAAATRYIEARLSPFALEILFNSKTTQWQLSYDGRNKEPITLPAKFPLVLVQGVEGIAVGLSTKILPHNFLELIDASINILKGKKSKVNPDFLTGGIIDVSDYKDGKRGGKIKTRAKIEKDKTNNLLITELPYNTTTNALIDSILKSNEKGQIKIKKVIDNTAANVEILIELTAGVSPDVTIEALYAFTLCENTISPNACIIVNKKPKFLSVSDILEISTQQTKQLLKLELEIAHQELLERWHNLSLEKIFIKYRIYRDIENCESWEEIVQVIRKGLEKHVLVGNVKRETEQQIKLLRPISDEDIEKLTEIKIKKISKYNIFKADNTIVQLENEIKEVQHNLENLVQFAIHYFESLRSKHGKGKERKTKIEIFENIKSRKVVANNAKLYVDRKEGFVGMSMKKQEFVKNCSDIDDIITFTHSGLYKVIRISDKEFIEKNIIHVDIWHKTQERKIYNVIYLDGLTGRAMVKRFNVTSITRNKAYNVTTTSKGSKILYFSANPNGESEIVSVQLSPGCRAKKKVFEFDFEQIGIKNRNSKGNVLTKYPVRKIKHVSTGKSSIGLRDIWMDNISGKLNTQNIGNYLGGFDTENKILAIYKNGTYEINEINFSKKFDANLLQHISKWNKNTVVSVLYYEGEKKWTMVKRFVVDTNSLNQHFTFISESSYSSLYFVSTDENPIVSFNYKDSGKTKKNIIRIKEAIEVKSRKAIGNKVVSGKISRITQIKDVELKQEKTNKKFEPGDSLEFEF